ncbi:MoxR family ATPase [Alicyclobacillus sp. SO9]|uniref:AAA family ATPase n=1 Tax=Alicyclobacillus sp. SO9 TaxID=2665646 RepID=UPI0018E88FD6|nr:MoxR family ATPase [Alicyclobacillus sp. SO9]QQE77158.1 MoxR family ATPase [Alicyclobacillus sp. SO9]
MFDQSIQSKLIQVIDELEKKVIGQRQVIRHTLAAMLAGGHILFEDIPGTGKTTLATSLARVLGLDFSRVQATPDLLPSELTGTMVFHPGKNEFQFRQGPVFTQLLLVDEINRATPRTQSALLEAMAEQSVSVDGTSHVLRQPFLVMATANPIESQGVFPLPEAQLDRFLVRLQLGYTNEADEIAMVERIRFGNGFELQPILSGPDVIELRDFTRKVHVAPDVLQYIVRLCRQTREHEQVELGASPRAVLAVTAFAQGLAVVARRDYVIPDDVQEALVPVLDHRLKTFTKWARGTDTGEVDVLQEVLKQVPVPTEFAEVKH